MIDWSLVAEVAGGGFGVTILVLVILSLLAWVVGLVLQRTQIKSGGNLEKKAKGK